VSILHDLEDDAGYLRAGIYGFGGAGKTRTAVELAIGVRDYFHLEDPIGFFDTESGVGYVSSLIKSRTGRPPRGLKSRSFSDLMQFSEECLGQCSVVIIDSATHVWREVVDSYMRDVNERLEDLATAQRRPFVPRRTMEGSDWGIVKSAWARWTDWYINAPIHVIVCGRAGYEYSDREDEEGNTESVKVGTKMKAESEFAFEHALLVEMQRIQRFDGDHTFLHRATIVKDKFDGCLDGKQMEDPTFAFFAPHVARLKPAGHKLVDLAVKTHHSLGGDSGWHREKQARAIVSEEIDGELQRAHPGQTAVEKQARRDLLEKVFGTVSWTAISESTHSDRLRRGLAELRAILRPVPSLSDSTDPRDQIPDWPSDLSAAPPADGLPGASSPTSVDGGSAALSISSGDPADPSPAAPPARGAAADQAPTPAPTSAAALPGENSIDPADKPAAIRPRGRRGSRNTVAPAPEAQTAIPVEQPARRIDQVHSTPEDPDVREIAMTIAQLDLNPDWEKEVEKKIRELPDGTGKSQVWGQFFDWTKAKKLRDAREEAEARAAGSQP
jgi:hypothetical protein